MSATGKKGVKRKTNHKTIDFKFQIIQGVEKGIRTKSEIAKENGISLSTLSTWIANEETIEKVT